MIKVGMLISYDYKLALRSLKSLYSSADSIILSIDVERKTWSTQKFEIPQEFFESVRGIDKFNKIRIVEGEYSKYNGSVMDRDTNQRNQLAAAHGPGGWHIQIDADEYFVNFDGFCNYLKKLSPDGARRLQVYCKWVTLYKQLDGGILYIDNDKDIIPIATTCPEYSHARLVESKFVETVTSNFCILHQSWARDESEIRQKINSWSHSHEIDANYFFQIWKSANKSNYHEYRNFHPLTASFWPKLGYFEGGYDEMIDWLMHVRTSPRSLLNFIKDKLRWIFK